jgi:hypothetical protein
MPSDTIGIHELESLTRHYSGLVHRCRLEAFGDRLARGRSGEVLRNRCGFTADRWTIWLRDGSALRLRLYHPCRLDVTAVLSLRWVGDDGWHVGVRGIDGDCRVLRAYRATYHPARDAAGYSSP